MELPFSVFCCNKLPAELCQTSFSKQNASNNVPGLAPCLEPKDALNFALHFPHPVSGGEWTCYITWHLEFTQFWNSDFPLNELIISFRLRSTKKSNSSQLCIVALLPSNVHFQMKRILQTNIHWDLRDLNGSSINYQKLPQEHTPLRKW